jgi:hypothetical protein
VAGAEIVAGDDVEAFGGDDFVAGAGDVTGGTGDERGRGSVTSVDNNRSGVSIKRSGRKTVGRAVGDRFDPKSLWIPSLFLLKCRRVQHVSGVRRRCRLTSGRRSA